MIYATEVIVKKIQRFTTEIKDKEYDKESVFIEHYQYEELYDQNDHDYLMLQVQNSEINLTLKTTCFGGIESILKCSYPSVLDNKRSNYSIVYKKHNVNAVICHFDGYTGLHSEEECITINEQLENIKKDKTLKPYWDYSPKEVPILEKFREDIYMFLASSKDKL